MTTPFTPSSVSPSLRRRATATAIEQPKLLGNWQLNQLVGQGSFTQVYSARPLGCPPTWPADYVIKLLKPEYQSDDLAKRMLEREAEVGRQTSHPHLVPILETHLDTEIPHLVMPRLQGASLQQAIERVGRLVVPQALWLTRQIAQALQHLHVLGWVHGDVKPANIIVSKHGHATLIDLGSTMRFDESLFVDNRPFVGSMAYVAPELLTSTNQTQPACDIYSLGVTLYQMLAGRLPFIEHDAARLVEAHLRKVPPQLQAQFRDIPDEVAEFVQRMLAKSSLRRPLSGDPLIDALTELEIETLQARFPEDNAA